MPTRNPSPKFWEAFENFKKDVETQDVKSFQQLWFQFMIWGGGHTPMTHKQTEALKYQAYEKKIGYVSVEQDERRGRVYRNVGNGQYVSREEYVGVANE